MYGAIEAGGTKFVVAVSDEELKIIEQIVIPTTTPEETFSEVFKFFDRFTLKGIGIGSFGPIDVNQSSKTYGYITTTPKKHWGNTNFKGVFEERYNVPVGWTTDVNAAALAEYTSGAAQGKDSCVYVTVGTGIGGGAVINGKVLEGFNHPEMGHFHVPRHEKDTYAGNCNFHGDCLEGLASGPAIEGRYRVSGKELPKDHEAWDIEAHYLAHAALAFTTILSPSCIIFGGGVMGQRHLIEKVRVKFVEILNHYLELPPVDEYILPAGLGSISGIQGSLLIAKKAVSEA